MIKLQGVTKVIKKKKVLDQINLEIRDGEFILLRGHNGCGKTMLLRVICGLLSPDEGTVLRDRDYRYGIIIETPAFLSAETAEYNLNYLAGFTKRIGPEQIEETLRQFGLYEDRKKKVRTFSLGMKQRLALAQAVMEDPDMLLLDEPFNAIDDENLEIIVALLNELHAAGKTILIASHGDYTKNCDFTRMITMSNGKIKEEQTMDSVR